MEDAIKKAIEGGYRNEKSHCYRCGLRRREATGLMLGCKNDKGTPYKSHLFRRPTNRPEVYLLDPAFWQALAKACGWKTIIADDGMEATDVWFVQWHRFIDHLAQGKDADSFFKDLLSK